MPNLSGMVDFRPIIWQEPERSIYVNKQTEEKKENRGKLSRKKRVKGGNNKEEHSRWIVDSSEKSWEELQI